MIRTYHSMCSVRSSVSYNVDCFGLDLMIRTYPSVCSVISSVSCICLV